MVDYNAQLIDLLNEKIQLWEHWWSEERKAKNRLKKEVRELRNELAAQNSENSDTRKGAEQ